MSCGTRVPSAAAARAAAWPFAKLSRCETAPPPPARTHHRVIAGAAVSHARSDTRSDASANAAARNGAASAAKAASSADEPSHTAANALSTASRVSGHGSRLPEIDASDDVSEATYSVENVSDAFTNASLNAGNRTVQRARSERSTSDSFATEPTHAQAASRLSCFLCASSKRSAGTSSRTARSSPASRAIANAVAASASRCARSGRFTRSKRLRSISRREAATLWRVAARANRGSNSRLSATSVALATRGSASASARIVASSSADASKTCEGGVIGGVIESVVSFVSFVCARVTGVVGGVIESVVSASVLSARARRSSASAFLNSRVLPSRSASRCFAVAAARSKSRVAFARSVSKPAMDRAASSSRRASASASPRVSDARASVAATRPASDAASASFAAKARSRVSA